MLGKIISIHAAREGGDRVKVLAERFADISIHAAREGGDYIVADVDDTDRDFNPRRP